MDEILESLKTKDVVVDTDSRFCYIGSVKGYDDRFLELSDVAIYDEMVVKVTLEEFLIECTKHGTPVSRGKTLINRERILAISTIEDIVLV